MRQQICHVLTATLCAVALSGCSLIQSKNFQLWTGYIAVPVREHAFLATSAELPGAVAEQCPRQSSLPHGGTGPAKRCPLHRHPRCENELLQPCRNRLD